MALGATTVFPVTLDAWAVQAIYAIASITSVYLGYVVWQHRKKTGAVPLFVAIVGGWWWSTSLFLQTVVSNYETSVVLLQLNYVGVVVAVAAIFLFTLEYTGREHLVDRRTIALLSIEPLLVVVLLFVGPTGLFFELSPASRATGVEMSPGIGFLLHTVYSYALILAGSVLIVGLVYRTRALYRGQLAVLLGAVLLPAVPNVLSILRLINFDATPVGFLVADGLYTVAITRYRLIDLAPIARDRVINTLNTAVFVVDTDHRLVDVNPAGEDLAAEFTGQRDLIGADARELLELVPELRTLYADIVTHGIGRTVEYEIGGGHFLAEATPIQDAQDRTVGWLFVVRDITQRKRREEELRERNDQLDKFASVVSHDLRNPLQVASGRIEIARETDDVEHLDAAETALDRMEAIVDDVLTLARSGDSVTNLQPVSLADAARVAWKTVDTRDVALRVETTTRVTADRDRLTRLLENLFRNAVEHGVEESPGDATGEGAATSGGRIRVTEPAEDRQAEADSRKTPSTGDAEMPPALTVTVGLLQADGRGVGFSVADDGRGIPPDERDRIFESGYSTGDEGTGFGLTIVSQIAGAHGWDVRVTESVEGGACFEFTDVEVVND